MMVLMVYLAHNFVYATNIKFSQPHLNIIIKYTVIVSFVPTSVPPSFPILCPVYQVNLAIMQLIVYRQVIGFSETLPIRLSSSLFK